MKLKAGQAGAFLEEELASGQIDSGLVSPNAKVLALVRRRGDDPPDQTCVSFHTLKPEVTTDAGPAGRISGLGWLPDSSGVVVAVTDGVGIKARSMLTRIGLDGNRTTLCAGNHPSVLPDRKRILFAVGEGDEHKWMTCDFDGKDLSQFGNGFTGYQSAAVPRRGGRVMFLKPGGKSGALLTPVVVESDGSGEREVPVESHAWTHASW